MTTKSTCRLCQGKHKSQGFCDKHYRKWLSDGKPDPEIWTPAERPTICRLCGKKHHCRGLCKSHYEKWYRLTEPRPDSKTWVPAGEVASEGTEPGSTEEGPADKICKTCGREHYANGFCESHYQLSRAAKIKAGTWHTEIPTCRFCQKLATSARRMCPGHYQMWRRDGKPELEDWDPGVRPKPRPRKKKGSKPETTE